MSVLDYQDFKNFKTDYCNLELSLVFLKEKYSLCNNEYVTLVRRVREETNFDRRGKHKKNVVYTLWDYSKVYYKKSNKNKRFYLKWNHTVVTAVGGFIEPFTVELIHELIE